MADVTAPEVPPEPDTYRAVGEFRARGCPNRGVSGTFGDWADDVPDAVAAPVRRAARVAALIAAVRERASAQAPNPRTWAHRLRQRELHLEPLTAAQRRAWREVLGEQQT